MMVIWLIYRLKKRLVPDGRTDGLTDGRTDGRTLAFLELLLQLKICAKLNIIINFNVNVIASKENLRKKEEEAKLLQEVVNEIERKRRRKNVQFTWSRCFFETCLLG